MCTNRITSLVCWAWPVFVAHSTSLQAYRKLSPVTTDDASCFNASPLTVNAGTTDFPHITDSMKPPFFQQAVSVMMIVDHVYHYEEEGGMLKTNWIFEQTSLPYVSTFISKKCAEREVIFRSLQYYIEHGAGIYWNIHLISIIILVVENNLYT